MLGASLSKSRKHGKNRPKWRKWFWVFFDVIANYIFNEHISPKTNIRTWKINIKNPHARKCNLAKKFSPTKFSPVLILNPGTPQKPVLTPFFSIARLTIVDRSRNDMDPKLAQETIHLRSLSGVYLCERTDVAQDLKITTPTTPWRTPVLTPHRAPYV